MYDISNMKNILVVGSLGGMGYSLTNRLVKGGYNVFGLDIKDTCDIKDVHYYKCDITSEESINNAYSLIKDEIDTLDAIIDVAGIYIMDSLLEIEDKDLKRILDINVLGIQRVVKVFFPLLKKGSKIVITTSELSTLDPLPFNGIYTMSKSLLEKYIFSLRMEVNNFGIKVISFRPGAVKTNLLNDSTSSMDKMCEKTVIHKEQSKNFKHIVDSVESKSVSPDKVASKLTKIIKKKHPKYVYRLNNNFALKLLNALPDRLQVKIISKIIK